MNERILNLLSLCMQAKEKGHRVSFTFDSYSTDVFHFVRGENESSIKRSFHLYPDDDFDCIADEAETYLKGLIA